MIGYFRVESKVVGRYISPYRSVLPSRAFTVNGIGGVHPAATSREMSLFSSVATSLPLRASRSTVVGGTSGRE